MFSEKIEKALYFSFFCQIAFVRTTVLSLIRVVNVDTLVLIFKEKLSVFYH